MMYAAPCSRVAAEKSRSASSDDHAHPMPSQARLDGLDIARFIAFAGMVIVNFNVVMGAEGDAGILMLLSSILTGKAAATFVVLAGIGLTLADRDRDKIRSRTIVIKRGVFLLALGLINAQVFEADILHYYGFYFLFGVWLIRTPSYWLVIAVALLNSAFFCLLFVLDFDTGWNWDDYTYADFWTLAGFVRNLMFNGWHPVIPWLGFLLVGFLLGRLQLSHRNVQDRLIAIGLAAVGLAHGARPFLAQLLGAVDPELSIFASTSPVPPMPLYFIAGCGAACLVVGLCLRCASLLERVGVSALLRPAGRQTLTLYIAHILLGMGTLEALDMLGGQTAATATLAALIFCLASVLYAMAWSKFFDRGPAEALMRRITATH